MLLKSSVLLPWAEGNQGLLTLAALALALTALFVEMVRANLAEAAAKKSVSEAQRQQQAFAIEREEIREAARAEGEILKERAFSMMVSDIILNMHDVLINSIQTIDVPSANKAELSEDLMRVARDTRETLRAMIQIAPPKARFVVGLTRLAREAERWETPATFTPSDYVRELQWANGRLWGEIERMGDET